MSVLIKGMGMPKGCAVCPYCDRNWSNPKCHAKSAKGRYMAQKLFLSSRRQDWCPLVEVQKHGRLIDADEFEKYVELEYETREISHPNWIKFRVWCGDQPTVIEPEEEESDETD